MNERDLLIETTPFMPPARILDGLSTEDAERRPAQSPPSIAEVVAHMAFWQEWFGRRAQGQGEPMARHAEEGWPAVASGSWPSLRERFLAHLERLAALGADGGRVVAPPLEFPPLAAYTVADALVHV